MSALRCIDGQLWRHDPQFDDPEMETEIGTCPDCAGNGCGEKDEAIPKWLLRQRGGQGGEF